MSHKFSFVHRGRARLVNFFGATVVELLSGLSNHGTPMLGLEMADKEQNRLVHAAAILKMLSQLENFDL